MSNIIQALEKEQIKDKKIPDFQPGDTVIVQVKVREANRERLQAFEGVVIAKRNRGINSAFTVRKVSHGEGVERVFQTYSPMIATIKVKRKGDVHQAKLYYLRDLAGRKARIKEKIGAKAAAIAEEAKEAPAKKAPKAEKPSEEPGKEPGKEIEQPTEAKKPKEKPADKPKKETKEQPEEKPKAEEKPKTKAKDKGKEKKD